MGREYGPAIDMFVDRSRVFQNARPRGAIVIHKTASNHVGETAQETAEYFATTSLLTSSHFVIGRDGTVVQCVSLNDGAAANCCLTAGYDSYWNQYGQVNLNLVTISIEHVDESLWNTQDPTQEQLKASYDLCAWLKDNYDMQSQDIETHASIDPVNRAHCPGNYDMQALISYVAAHNSTTSGGTDVLPVIDQSKTMTGVYLQQAMDVWGDPKTWNSGICGVWQALYANHVKAGAPVGPEEHGTDDSGKPIVYRIFDMGVRIEWENGNGRAFTLTQEFQFK